MKVKVNLGKAYLINSIKFLKIKYDYRYSTVFQYNIHLGRPTKALFIYSESGAKRWLETSRKTCVLSVNRKTAVTFLDIQSNGFQIERLKNKICA